MRAMDGRIVRCGIISSCQSAATSEIVKRFWSRTHVRSAVTSIATFTFVPLVLALEPRHRAMERHLPYAFSHRQRFWSTFTFRLLIMSPGIAGGS